MTEIFLTIATWFVLWLILLPTSLLLATPYVLVAAAFKEPPYGRAVVSYYKFIVKRFTRLWAEVGW